MSEWNCRFAEKTDAEAFSRWAAFNPFVDSKDALAGTGKNNPTVLHFVVEKDGVPIVDAPVFLSAVLAHLSLNPDADGKDKLRALNMLKDFVSAFMVQYGVRQIETMSKPEYAIAQWALNHGFEQDPRVLLKLDLNQELTEDKHV